MKNIKPLKNAKRLYFKTLVILTDCTPVLFGTLWGGVIAFAKGSRNSVLRILANVYIEIFRAIPILVLLLWIYYVAPPLTGITLSAFASAVLALVLNLAAFAAENIRAGIESVPKVQYEAAYSMGASKWQAMRHIVLPQAVPNMVPNLMDQWITSIKLTSFASLIGVNELVHQAGIVVSQSFRPLEIYTALAVWYLIILLPLIITVRIFEKKLRESR